MSDRPVGENSGNFNLFKNIQGMFRGKSTGVKERVPQLPSMAAVEDALENPTALKRLLQVSLNPFGCQSFVAVFL